MTTTTKVWLFAVAAAATSSPPARAFLLPPRNNINKNNAAVVSYRQLQRPKVLLAPSSPEKSAAAVGGKDDVVVVVGAPRADGDAGTVPDVGKEIFLSHMDDISETAELVVERYDAEDGSAALHDSVRRQMARENNNNRDVKNSPPSSLPSITTPTAKKEDDGIVVVPPALDRTTLATAKDNVDAILAASEEAVAALSLEESLTGSIEKTVKFSVPKGGPSAAAATTRQEIDIVPAASLVGGPAASVESFSPPSVGKILRFALPAICVWLCGPLLSLIDTSAVGLLSGTAQQAALNPAVAITDYAALLIAFLFTGTTNLLAAAREKDRMADGSPVATKTLIGSLQMSTFVGAGLGAVLFFFSRPLLRTLIGNDTISPAVFAAANKYVRIRALGMPAAAVIGSAQAACLGMQDIKSPLYVLGAAAGVNFLCDLTLVGSTHPWIGGAAGAAWATTFSQYAALGLFMRWLCNRPKNTAGETAKVVDVSKAILELTGKPTSEGSTRRQKFRESLKSRIFPWNDQPRGGDASRRGFPLFSSAATPTKTQPVSARPSSDTDNTKPKEKSFSIRGFLDGKFSIPDLMKVPSKDTINEFKPYVLPVTSTQIGRVSGYVAMSHVVSSSFGTVSMAAQSVLLALFYCLCPVADSLSLTAQSFVPSISEKSVSRGRSMALKRTLLNFFKAGALFGTVMALAVCGIPLLSGFFTSDASVVSLVNAVAPMLVLWFAVHGFVCSSEGMLLAQKDLKFLGRMYAGFSVVLPFFMFRVKRSALLGRPGIGLASIWQVFLAYQISRCVLWAGRTIAIQRRTTREADELDRLVELAA